MGRTRKIVENNKKHLTKAEQKERLAVETAYRVGRDELQASEMLTERGRAEFERLKRQATWLDNIDRNELTIYCYYWERAQALMDACRAKALNEKARRALREYTSEMRAISLKLGLSSIDRLRIAAPAKEPEQNKFLKHLK